MNFDSKSEMENDLAEFLNNNNINFKRNDRKLIRPYELDFFIPEKNLAIELNGLYQHSELSCGKNSSYHYKKYKLCNDKGIKFLSFFQDEYWRKKQIIYNMILCRLNLIKQKRDARKLIIKEISNDKANKFYEHTHISGVCFGSSLNVALVDENEIIHSCMSFQKIQNKFIILRFSNMLNTIIRGGFSKLLNYVIKKYSPKIIETYSDNRFSNGDLYKNHGFKMKNESPPFYFVTNYNERFYSKQFTRPKIKNRFQIDIENKTTWECIKEIGYDRIWDCGKKKWVLELY